MSHNIGCCYGNTTSGLQKLPQAENNFELSRFLKNRENKHDIIPSYVFYISHKDKGYYLSHSNRTRYSFYFTSCLYSVKLIFFNHKVFEIVFVTGSVIFRSVDRWSVVGERSASGRLVGGRWSVVYTVSVVRASMLERTLMR